MLVEHIPEWQLTAEDEAQIATLLARCFTTDFGGRSFYQTRQHLRLVHRRDGRIVGHMALQFRAMRLGERLVHVAGLGDVATDPGYRGQGIAAGLLRIAISEARASRSDFVLLFGTARLYAAAGFRPVDNTMTWIDLTGARTHEIHREPAESLMVLPLGALPWDDAAPLDLLGNLF
jgi:predicted N-acetyltransferase YhbS